MKELLGMVDGKLNATMQAFEDAFARIDAAEVAQGGAPSGPRSSTDPTIYPFHRRR